MAQYYEVLSQTDKITEENRQFYTTIDETQTIQYVLAPDNQHHQFHPQQIVLSADQVMVVDNSQSQVIIDQSQIAYQSPTEQQFIIHDGTVDFRNNRSTQQIFYMEGNNVQPEQVVVEQPIIQTQPIVLNHQMSSGNSIVRTGNKMVGQSPQQATPVRANPVRMPQINPPRILNNPIPSPRPVPKLVRQQSPIVQQKNALTQQAKTLHQNLQSYRRQQQLEQFNKGEVVQKSNQSNVNENHEAVSLPDGTVVSVATFKRMQQNRLGGAANALHAQPAAAADFIQQTPTPDSIKKNRAPPVRSNRGGIRNARGIRGRGNFNQFTAPPVRNNVQQPPRYMLNQQHQHLKEQQQANFLQLQQQHLLQQRQQAQQIRPASQANYVIQPPHVHQKPPQQNPLPSYIPSSQIQQIIESTPISEEFSDSIRMLVLLANGEQRLITFTLPKEACTIQEILEQVNVPFENDTNIQVTEANTNGINYIVTVGNVPNFGYTDVKIEENSDFEDSSSSIGSQNLPTTPNVTVPIPEVVTQLPPEPKTPTSPEPPKETVRFVPGQLALCANCGYLSEDFNKCMRCKRKLPDNVKAIPASATTIVNKNDLRNLNEKKLALLKATAAANKSPNSVKKKSKPKLLEHETVVVSSDEEDDEEKKINKSVNEELLQKLGNSVTISPVTKEPTFIEMQRHCKNRVPPNDDLNMTTTIECRTIRIGSYRFVPPEKVLINYRGFTMHVPHPHKAHELLIVKIHHSDIVKVLVSFNKSLPVIFYYLNPTVGATIREMLNMGKGSNYYYDPLSEKEEAHRRITLLPDEMSDGDKEVFQHVYGGPPYSIMDELTAKEANDILIKTCPKELTKTALGLGNFTEIKQLLMYPPEGRGRIAINTEDYVCLAQDQFLNDVIIDFYIKYLVDNLPEQDKEKVHVFSTFFYKRLTTKPIKASRKSQPTELDPNLTASQKRHARVRTWTKSVNLFEKDFVIVPINENAHWFLAIICFPGMEGCQTMDGEPYIIEPRQCKKKKETTTVATIGNVTVTTTEKLEKIEKTIVCEDPDLSDKDEAEGDDSELESDDSDETAALAAAAAAQAAAALIPKIKTVRPPIKQPCILIFDSLAGASRSRVVATLRDYLSCEYKAKMENEKIFNKDNIKGACPKIPQQTNFTDCGLYLLQYVEHFFKAPIKDYYIPISHLKNWFEEIIVTKKREDISLLIKSLMVQSGKDVSIVPEILFPTVNGIVVERELDEEDLFEDIGEQMHDNGREDDGEEDEESEQTDAVDSASDANSEKPGKVVNSPIKPSSESVPDNKNSDFVQTVENLPKPDISEFPRQTNKDTLSYLKAKRIIRHKNSDGPELKKAKSE